MIPVYEPWTTELEQEYVNECVETNWISSQGKFVDEFERQFSDCVDCSHGIATANGTVALHLALEALGVGEGDEVIVPNLTFIATANAVRYTGAEPVPVDVDEKSWGLDPDRVADAVTERTRGIIPVHLYGYPCDMRALGDLASAYDLFVIEDAAEAHGSEFDGSPVGGIGDVAIFSFYGNKTLTTGEGGMVVTDDPELASECRSLRDHAMDESRRYVHHRIGYNYRMTNMQAAVGVAQLERREEIFRRKREVEAAYRSHLGECEAVAFCVSVDGADVVPWMAAITMAGAASAQRVVQRLEAEGIETRPFFVPIDQQKPYADARTAIGEVSVRLSEQGILLPSSPTLERNEIREISRVVETALQDAGAKRQTGPGSR